MKKTLAKNEAVILFPSLLMKWDRKKNQRKMPWKGIKDPYKIWLSEIILQQTRVEQGEPYYISFIATYPTICDLAKADEQAVFKLWQGLGYYNRCRNMLESAKYICNVCNGIFPSEYSAILALKGVGEYTAAAVASFAYNLSYAVVDGNVVRVLSRAFALKDNYFDAKGKKEIQFLAQSLIDKKKPGLYNQAIMDLGASICKPTNPICTICPLQEICQAFKQQTISLFPIKKERKQLKERRFHFFILENKTHFFITQRNEKDIWKGLYTPLMIESEKISQQLLPTFLDFEKISKPLILTQLLTHQRITGYFYPYNANVVVPKAETSLIKIKKEMLTKYPLPRMIASFFEKKNYL